MSLKSTIACILVMLALAASVCEAATIELQVRERDGPPLLAQSVVLRRTAAAGEDTRSMFSFERYGTTGAGGKVTFSDVRVGSYTFELPGVADPALVNPAENPYAPAPQFTVAKDGDRVSLVLELWRGVSLTAQLVIDRGDIPRSKLILRSLDGLHTREIMLDEGGRWTGMVVPARWDAEFQFPAGYLLVDLVASGESLPGHTARLDLASDSRSSFVTAYLSAQALITGRLIAASNPCAARVVATLIEPAGTWFAAATARGGSEFRDVVNQFVQLCVYKLWLPEGTWAVRLMGPPGFESDPPEAVVSIAAGEARTLDFTLRFPEREGRRPLRVSVYTPDHRHFSGAVVEVFRRVRDVDESEPIATGKTTFMAAEFDLPEGMYTVVAGHPTYLESEPVVAHHNPDAKDQRGVSVTLREGARVRAHAADEKGISVRDVEFSIAPAGDPPEMRLRSEEVRASKLLRQVRVDDTGYAEVPGLYGGDYKMTARMTGEASGTKFVRVRKGSDTASEVLEAALTEGQTLEVNLVVLPAASLSGTLACTDRGTLPPRASFRVFDATRTPDPFKDDELLDGALLAADGLGLGGKELDRFRVGPLETGIVALASRPSGHEYWSWPPGGLLLPEGASSFTLDQKGMFDTGTVEIECGPVVMLVPKIASGEAAPDLRLGRLELVPDRTRDVEDHSDRLFVLRLSEGKAKLKGRFRHPYLIPPEIRVPEGELDLVRGKLYTLDLSAEAVGGIIEVHGEFAAARITSSDGRATVRSASGITVTFPGTPPGTYRVDACGDPECRTIRASWSDVQIVPAQSVVLPR